MNSIKKIVSSLVLLLLVVAVIYSIKDTNKESTVETKKKDENFATNPIGKQAPEITLKNLNGEMVKLSDYRGKKVIVNFWATWCPPCKEEVPEIEKFHLENPDVIILSVNIDPTQDIQSFVDEYHITFPVLLDDGSKVANSYGTFKIPETYFINAEGLVKNKRIGGMNFNNIKTLVDIM